MLLFMLLHFPPELREAQTLGIFKALLKTHFFKLAFDC